MKLYGIGNALLHYREKAKLSQLQLCEGICNEMTISRIETGDREFDSLISETLLERLGKTTNRFEFVLNDEDYECYQLREKIVAAMNDREFEKVKEYIAKYRRDIPTSHILHEQFLLFYEALVMKAENQSEKEIVNLLYKAIGLTRRDFREQATRIRLYSGIEIKIIYELFLYENYSFETLRPLFEFMGEMYDEQMKQKFLLPFFYQFGKRYLQEENWSELDRIADDACEFLQSGRNYFYLLDFYFMKLSAEYHLYRNTECWHKKRIQLIERCNEIYYMSMTIENQCIMKKTEEFCKEKLECQVTM